MKTITTTCINGNLHVGDLVISTPDVPYACLIGQVTHINLLETPEHDAETKNETDDIHLNFFVFNYPKKRIRKITKVFSKYYGKKKHFGNLTLDDVIMSPEYLICIAGIETGHLYDLIQDETGINQIIPERVMMFRYFF